MLSNSGYLSYGSYGFRFTGEQQENVAGIHSLGWEKVDDYKTYNWDGMKRSETGKIIFQYTLNGYGEIIIENQKYELAPGHAFLVDIPSKHRYYLPRESDGWEFVFITLYGNEAQKSFELLKNKFGQILHLDSSSPPIKQLFDLMNKAQNMMLQDAFVSSAYAYSFLMNLISHVKNSDNKPWPESVLRAIYFIQQNYDKPLSLDDIVQAAKVSKYHFTRLFHQCTNLTPMKFVTKTRMEQALKLLKDDTLTIEEIAKKVGYSNGNYFIKAFRTFIGVPPGKYRSGKNFLPFDQIITD